MASPPVLRLLAHELRSPASVIAGYARMLREGRLDENARAQALVQIERAALRISHISRQASDLARWLAPDQRVPAPAMTVRALMSRAVAASATPEVPVNLNAQAETMSVLALDPASLAEAIGSVIDAVNREAMEDPVQVVVRRAGPPAACEILVAPASRFGEAGFLAEGDDNPPIALDRGGQGLSLVVAAAVISAHNGRLWGVGDPPIAVGIRLPAETGQVA